MTSSIISGAPTTSRLKISMTFTVTSPESPLEWRSTRTIPGRAEGPSLSSREAARSWSAGSFSSKAAITSSNTVAEFSLSVSVL